MSKTTEHILSCEDPRCKFCHPTSFEDVWNEQIEFSIPTFKNATSISSLIKLKGEADETIHAIKNDGIYTQAEEYADCFLCLIDSAERAGIPIRRIISNMREKIEINRRREWIEHPDGTYSHKK